MPTIATPPSMRLSWDEEKRPTDGAEVFQERSKGCWLKEAAGMAFHRAARAALGLDGKVEEDGMVDGQDGGTDANDTREEGEDGSQTKEGTEANGFHADGSDEASKRRRKKKKKNGEKKWDYYQLLGLENLRWMATANDIKKAYRSQALKHHPDKKLAGVEDEKEKEQVEEYFKAIQKAWEVLSDPKRRREYDSTDEFDDYLPKSCKEGEFFQVFGSAFARQSRWSEKKVPDLGDEKSPINKVKAFYDFWFTFPSWREFPHEDEFDLAEAEDRFQRRWMERENAKLREKGKKEEKKRIRAFVELAQEHDPRIQREKQEKAAAREAKKQAKLQKAQEEEEKRVMAEKAEKERLEVEARVKAAASAEAKKKKEKDRKLMQKERSFLRRTNSELQLVSEDTLQCIFDAAPYEDLVELNKQIAAEGIDKEKMITAIEKTASDLSNAKKEDEMEAKEKAQQLENAEKDATGQKHIEDDWSEEELRMLDKALRKYPVGSGRRWKLISEYLRTKTETEVVQMVKHRMAAVQGLTKQDGHVVKDKHKKNLEISDAATQRHETPIGNGNIVQNIGETHSTDALTEQNGPKMDWTPVQQQSLIRAVKTFGKDVPDRWERIAEAVPGKTRAQCMKKFTELRETVKAKKAVS